MELPVWLVGSQLMMLVPVALAVRVVLSPWQIVWSLVVFTVGKGRVVTVKLMEVCPQLLKPVAV